jgi:hypothetical protein
MFLNVLLRWIEKKWLKFMVLIYSILDIFEDLFVNFHIASPGTSSVVHMLTMLLQKVNTLLLFQLKLR